MRKSLLLTALMTMLLLACSAERTVHYRLHFDVPDASTQQQLTLMSMRVIERRLQSMGEQLIDKEVSTKGNTTTIGITVGSRQGAEALTSSLIKPFVMQVMLQAETATGSDVTVQGQGSFNATGITETDFDRVEAHQEPQTDKGEVRLVLTGSGHLKMATLFRSAKGKDIAIFVRGRLVSKLHVETSELKGDVIIRNVPNPALAQVFADDVTVGLHVIFVPVP